MARRIKTFHCVGKAFMSLSSSRERPYLQLASHHIERTNEKVALRGQCATTMLQGDLARMALIKVHSIARCDHKASSLEAHSLRDLHLRIAPVMWNDDCCHARIGVPRLV